MVNGKKIDGWMLRGGFAAMGFAIAMGSIGD